MESSLVQKLSMEENRNYNLEEGLSKTYELENLNMNGSNSPLEDISYGFDFLLTPGSHFKHAQKSVENPEREVGSLEKYFTYGVATMSEALRVSIYTLFGAIMSPIVPLAFIGAGLFGNYINKKTNENRK